jgi:hypothetical protein
MDLETAAHRLIENFADVCDTTTLGEMLWAFDQGRKSLGFYCNIIGDIFDA